MNRLKHEREEMMLKDLAADFLSRQSNRTSLITVTRVMLSDDAKQAHILLSVLPEDKERAALLFANRMVTEFRDYMKTRSKIRIIPFVKFVPDVGEHNRQRIEELSEEIEHERDPR